LIPALSGWSYQITKIILSWTRYPQTLGIELCNAMLYTILRNAVWKQIYIYIKKGRLTFWFGIIINQKPSFRHFTTHIDITYPNVNTVVKIVRQTWNIKHDIWYNDICLTYTLPHDSQAGNHTLRNRELQHSYMNNSTYESITVYFKNKYKHD
jgi:hypothetical protein